MSKPLTSGVNVDRLDQLIKDLGVRVRVWKSTVCPNFKSLESLDHDVNCNLCSNNMIDFDCRETLALFQQQDLVEQFKLQGTFNMDELLVSFMAGVTLHIYSKIELLDFAEDFYEAVQRQENGDIDVLKYPACDVLAVFTAEDSNTQTRYYQGNDFTLDQNGSIKWTGSHRPDDRQIYSVYYRYHPVYRAIKAVHRDRYSQFNLRSGTLKADGSKTVDGKTYVKMPETWILKRDYLLDRKDSQGQAIAANHYYDPNEQ
jgi:hypothetical protein